MDVELVESIVRALAFLAGIIGNNCVAISSIPSKTSGICANETLFINFAVSNLITNYLVDLPDAIADRWFLGEAYCSILRFCADLSETSSIFTTFFISTFWHQKPVGSLKRGGAPIKMDKVGLVLSLLADSWATALAFSVPHFFFVSVEATIESEEDCVDVFPDAISRWTYDIIYLMLANALPLAGMLFTSGQIVVTLLKNQQCIRTPFTGPAPPRRPPVYTRVPAPAASGAPPGPSKPGQVRSGKPNSSSQVRVAKSVVAVASVFLVCWLTHLLLRITNNFHTSSLVVEVASYIAASYTCTMPYIFLHGVKKLTCPCKKYRGRGGRNKQLDCISTAALVHNVFILMSLSHRFDSCKGNRVKLNQIKI
ncbi:beta-3 adrenergic receptor [Phyllopteryx taeniolatus]|uniref:beta-3 adrenergic receptor n=1 Tax=Phyllopteryx taeniolatus TaxID=161469 RepID=UPI002AD301EC|nr:beta-3 adrenergic receptor [Phyllopteryx taeniolatus]